MKNKLRKYNEFVNESQRFDQKLDKATLDLLYKKGDTSKITELRLDFREVVDSVTDNFTTYFSDLCKKRAANPEEDFHQIQRNVSEVGWDLESIKNLFSEKANELEGVDFLRWFKTTNLDNKSGYCDVYFWFIAKHLGLNPDIIPLGGDGWAGYDDPEELFIRYKYGYHQTKYGKMMMEQMKITQEEFKNIAVTRLKEFIKDNWDSELRRYLTNSKGLTYDEAKFVVNGINLKQFLTEDEVEIIISVGEIREIILENWPTSVKSSISEEELCAVFSKLFSGFGLPTYLTAGEFVITLQDY